VSDVDVNYDLLSKLKVLQLLVILHLEMHM